MGTEPSERPAGWGGVCGPPGNKHFHGGWDRDAVECSLRTCPHRAAVSETSTTQEEETDA